MQKQPNRRKSLRATNATGSLRLGAEHVASSLNVGAAALAEPPLPPPIVCSPPLALQATHTSRGGHCGALGATDRPRFRCRLPPWRRACWRSSSERRRCGCRLCHGRIEEAAAPLLAAARKARAKALPPLSMPPSNAAERASR